MREQIAGDKRRKYELVMRKREEFVKDNTVQSVEKREKKERERQEAVEYRPNFFPFTYGEEVEAKRAKLRDTLKDDLSRHMQESASKMKPNW